MSVKTKTALFRDLLYLKEVISYKQINAAAINNGIKASNLSRLIKELEALSGKQLFVRSSQGFTPTGEAISLCQKIINMEKIFEETAALIKPQRGSNSLKLYVSPNFSITNLKKFRQVPVSLCANEMDADVCVSNYKPANAENMICVENKIGLEFRQSVWVSSVNNTHALNLARFIISLMHAQ